MKGGFNQGFNWINPGSESRIMIAFDVESIVIKGDIIYSRDIENTPKRNDGTSGWGVQTTL
jgi:hypothetical protein